MTDIDGEERRDAGELPLVSIVTPSLDQGAFVEDTIRSVLAQDYPRVEHVVADGGSTDGTLEVLRRYPHLRWWSRPDSGQSRAINDAIEASAGTVIGWLNADDVYRADAVAAAVAALEAHPTAGLVYGDYVEIDERGEEMAHVRAGEFDLDHALNVGNVVAQPSTFIRRSALKQVGLLDPELHYAMDYDLWLRIARAGFDLVHVPGVWSGFRVHPASKTRSQGGRFWVEERAVMLRHGGRRLSPAFVTHHRTAAVMHGKTWLRRALPAGLVARLGGRSAAR